MASKLSDKMISTLLDALTRRVSIKGGGIAYQVSAPTDPSAPTGTLNALERRGLVEAATKSMTLSGHGYFLREATWLTEQGMSFLREALNAAIAKGGKGRDDVWRAFFGKGHNSDAVAAFLVGDIEGMHTVTRTRHERGAHKEQLSAEDGIRQMGNIIFNGQALLTRNDGTYLAALGAGVGAQTVFTPVRSAVEVEDVEHRMYVGVLRDDAKDMGTVGADNVRAAISNANGWPVEHLDDGTIRVGYSWFVPNRIDCADCGNQVTAPNGRDWVHNDGTPLCSSQPAEVREAAELLAAPAPQSTEAEIVHTVRNSRHLGKILDKAREDGRPLDFGRFVAYHAYGMTDREIESADWVKVRAVLLALEAEPVAEEAVNTPEAASELTVRAVEPSHTLECQEGDLEADERAATERAERLVPSGVSRLVVRLVTGARVEDSTEERDVVVGLVASELRAGARYTGNDTELVVRGRETTLAVSLAA